MAISNRPWWATWQALAAGATLNFVGGVWFTFVEPYWLAQILFGFACGWMGVDAIQTYREDRRPTGGPTIL